MKNKELCIDDIFDDFDYEEEDETINYKIGDYVIVKGWNFGGGGNGIKGIIPAQLLDKNDITLFPSGLLYSESDFVVKYNGNKRISVNNIIRHATNEEIRINNDTLHSVNMGYKFSGFSLYYIKKQGWNKYYKNI